ncbi:tetratricopeptide repeat protein [Campylobacter helveticus]|uniref:tetratricopeptide repeat protein n=1 Tax=Campylobacter helveticus TaxID=28898 RepID=UPI0009C3846B|nr:ATP-dependent nuclease subunit B [Campylobacter helveticus]ARE80082.1 putative tetratricopeptide repeat lipoprotein [Campylobacter helveticus]MCR2053977.1 ATP-dependent nuclease subunit B [Campylobacter helveticus]TNB56367.1 ATP-dependent nuclease subunit B [Campylobacter helveticus]TNB61601.1 ATP-dependent nuclease subunit B [Campylobacter helveticus]TNH33079.1 ATP-dependent nuclease subunit B [Campylobacter helveticus]
MYRNYLFIIITCLFLTSCASKNALNDVEFKPVKENALDKALMRAFVCEYYGEFKCARDIYLDLFEKNKNAKFLEQAFFLSLSYNLNKTKELNEKAQQFLETSSNIKRLSVLYSLSNMDLARAQKLALELLKDDDYPGNYELYGDILLRKNQLREALKYYQIAYKQLPNEVMALKMVGIYTLLNDTKGMKKFLINVRKKQGCSLKTCVLLSKIYLDEKNYKELESVYLELYELSLNENFLFALIEIYNKQNQKEKALKLALQYDLNDELKVFLFQNLKQFDKAKELSLKLYQASGDKEHLLRAAVFEFEEASAKAKPDLKVAKSVAKKFEEAMTKESAPLYLNYYGYLLIDYELDVKKGIELVELALQNEPNNFYYLDSLAWGYYKLKECEKAWDILKPTFADKEFANSSESKEHQKAIKACIK